MKAKGERATALPFVFFSSLKYIYYYSGQDKETPVQKTFKEEA